MISLLTAPVRSKSASPQPHSRPTSNSTGSSLELRPTGSRTTTPRRSLNEGSNDNLWQCLPSASQELPGSATRATTPNTSPNPMRRFSRTGIHPMLGAGLAIREAFGEYLLRSVQLAMQHKNSHVVEYSSNEHMLCSVLFRTGIPNLPTLKHPYSISKYPVTFLKNRSA